MENVWSTTTGDELSKQHHISGNHSANAGDFNMTDDDVTEEVTTNANLVSEINPSKAEEVPNDSNMATDTVEIVTEPHLTKITEETRSSLTQTQDFASPPRLRPTSSENLEDNEKTPTQSLVPSRQLTDGLNPSLESNNAAEVKATNMPDTGNLVNSRTLAHSQPLEILPVQMANNEQGSAARVYINTKVTPVLLEGMKWVAKNEPEKPLKWLSEFLAKRSADIEGI